MLTRIRIHTPHGHRQNHIMLGARPQISDVLDLLGDNSQKVYVDTVTIGPHQACVRGHPLPRSAQWAHDLEELERTGWELVDEQT